MVKSLKMILGCAAWAFVAISCGSNDKDEPQIPESPTIEVSMADSVLVNATVPSAVMGGNMAYSAYFPPKYTKGHALPVLYMLHGADGSNNDWLNGGQTAKLMRQVNADFVLICPNGTVDGKNLFYCNGYQGTAQYMTFFFNEFLPAIEEKYNVGGSRSKRMIGGLSMGGYGSIYYGGLHPEMFAAVYACSPATYIDGTPNLYDLWFTASNQGSELPAIVIEIGTEDFLYSSAASFHGFLDQNGIEHQWITREGTHDWNFWIECSPKIVDYAQNIFKND